MAKRKLTDAEVLEQYRTTPQQHATEYLNHATHDYSAHNILRLAVLHTPRPFLLHETFSKHEVALKFESFILRVRTPQRIGRTEITISRNELLGQLSVNKDIPFTVVARIVGELIASFQPEHADIQMS